MAKWILTGLLVLAGVVAWFAWSRRNVDIAMDNGTVVSHDAPASDADKMNQGAVDLDGNPTGAPAAPVGVSGATSSTAAPATPAAPTAHAVTGNTGSTAAGVLQSMHATPAPAAAPAADSQPELAPTGVRFGGSGKFQWYRQGNITWRIDTQSGATCIAFATMEEWKKPIVYSHGCGNA